MSQAFVREGGSRPRVFASEEGARDAIALYRAMDGGGFEYEVRPRDRGGWMLARISKTGEFDSWVEE